MQKSPIKRLHSAKETYIFKEPTNPSHPIVRKERRPKGVECRVCIHVVYVICVIFRKHSWYTVNLIQFLVGMANYLDLRVSSVGCICSVYYTIITQDLIQGISNVCA